MIKKLGLLLAVAAIFHLCGCAPSPGGVTHFTPVNNQLHCQTITHDKDQYLQYSTPSYEVTAALFEYASIMVMPLEITNKTGTDLLDTDYSVKLYDGKDMVPIKMHTRNSLMAVRAQMQGKGAAVPVGGIEGQLINTSINTLVGLTNIFSKSDIIKELDLAISHYFAFRTIYAHQKRSGVLCFMLDFQPEYPSTLIVKIKNEPIKMQFYPQQENKDN